MNEASSLKIPNTQALQSHSCVRLHVRQCVRYSTSQASSKLSKQSEFCLPQSLSSTGRRYWDGGQYSTPNSTNQNNKLEYSTNIAMQEYLHLRIELP